MVFNRVFTAVLLVGTLAFSVATSASAQQMGMAGTSASGMWRVRQTSNPLTAGVLILKQQGTNVIGSFPNGGSVKGTVNSSNPRELDFNWAGPRGSGWGKMTFSENWNEFHGQWGTPGQPGNDLYGSRVLIQINTTGMWNVQFTGQKFHSGKVAFTQKGTSFVGKWQTGHLTGSIPPGTVTINGTWQTIEGSGPLTITFSPDGKHFSGFWSYGKGKPNKGRIFGTKVAGSTAQVGTQ